MMTDKNLRRKHLVKIILLATCLTFSAFAGSTQDDSLVVMSDSTILDTSHHYLSINAPDSLFQIARNIAFEEKDNKLAIEVCRRGLSLAPHYSDMQILLGRLFAWEGHYDSAEVELKMVISSNPDYEDARLALADVYIWSKQFEAGLILLDEGIEKNGEQVEFHYKRGVCLLSLGNKEEALTAFQIVINLDSGHENAGRRIDELSQKKPVRRISLGYGHNRLTDTRTQWQMLVGESMMAPWHLLTIEAEQAFQFGPVIARFNYANRFEQDGMQLELESYPSFRKGTYAYAGLSYSWTGLFPTYKTGFELYQALPRAFEGSLGYRSLHFETLDLFVISGSFSKYWKNYWFSLRAFLTPQDVAFSQAWNVQARRYLKDAETFIELSMGQGETPGVGIGEEELHYLGSRNLGLQCQWKLNDLNVVKGIFSLANVEIREGAYRGDTGFHLAYAYRF